MWELINELEISMDLLKNKMLEKEDDLNDERFYTLINDLIDRIKCIYEEEY